MVYVWQFRGLCDNIIEDIFQLDNTLIIGIINKTFSIRMEHQHWIDESTQHESLATILGIMLINILDPLQTSDFQIHNDVDQCCLLSKKTFGM